MGTWMHFRVYLTAILFFFGWVVVSATDGPAMILGKHRVWLEKGLAWEHVEGDPDARESYAVGRVLYFGVDRRFGMFQGNIVRNGHGMGIDEGDGGRVFSGQWTLNGNNLKVNYRLVDAYKLMLPADQQPKIPGPVEERDVSLVDLKIAAPEFQFEGKSYQPSSIKESSLRELLEALDKQKGK